jgi:hypothetical protein
MKGRESAEREQRWERMRMLRLFSLRVFRLISAILGQHGRRAFLAMQQAPVRQGLLSLISAQSIL